MFAIHSDKLEQALTLANNGPRATFNAQQQRTSAKQMQPAQRRAALGDVSNHVSSQLRSYPLAQQKPLVNRQSQEAPPPPQKLLQNRPQQPSASITSSRQPSQIPTNAPIADPLREQHGGSFKSAIGAFVGMLSGEQATTRAQIRPGAGAYMENRSSANKGSDPLMEHHAISEAQAKEQLYHREQAVTREQAIARAQAEAWAQAQAARQQKMQQQQQQHPPEHQHQQQYQHQHQQQYQLQQQQQQQQQQQHYQQHYLAHPSPNLQHHVRMQHPTIWHAPTPSRKKKKKRSAKRQPVAQGFNPCLSPLVENLLGELATPARLDYLHRSQEELCPPRKFNFDGEVSVTSDDPRAVAGARVVITSQFSSVAFFRKFVGKVGVLVCKSETPGGCGWIAEFPDAGRQFFSTNLGNTGNVSHLAFAPFAKPAGSPLTRSPTLSPVTSLLQQAQMSPTLQSDLLRSSMLSQQVHELLLLSQAQQVPRTQEFADALEQEVVKGLQAEEEESDDDGSCENEKAEHMGPSALRESGCDAYQHALGATGDAGGAAATSRSPRDNPSGQEQGADADLTSPPPPLLSRPRDQSPIASVTEFADYEVEWSGYEVYQQSNGWEVRRPQQQVRQLSPVAAAAPPLAVTTPLQLAQHQMQQQQQHQHQSTSGRMWTLPSGVSGFAQAPQGREGTQKLSPASTYIQAASAYLAAPAAHVNLSPTAPVMALSRLLN